MVTQLLFGETVKIYKEKQPSWIKIKTAYDDFECWIDKKQVVEITKEEYDSMKESYISSDLVQVIQNIHDNSMTPIVLGSTLPNFKKNSITFQNHKYLFDGQVIKITSKLSKKKIAENACMYLNSPYLWGGRSPFGIDCSGFTQVVYKLNGIKLPRDAWQQAKKGQTLSFVEEAEVGDLAFFDNEEGNIIHVGILLSNHQIIHASGKVRIDKIDHQGIFNTDTGKYTHRLRIIKKII